MKGRRKSGKSFFRDNLFFVDYDQFFLYKHNEEWKAHDKYCFVKPIKIKEKFLKTSGNQLINKGLRVGDEVSFQPESEYEFYVDGEKGVEVKTNNTPKGFAESRSK